MTFDPCNSSTWPVAMTAHEVAQIFRRSVMGLKKSCQLGRCVPAPFQRHPYLWRKVDVVRHVEGARQTSNLRRVG